MFPVVITFRSEEGRTLCTLQHHLHAPHTQNVLLLARTVCVVTARLLKRFNAPMSLFHAPFMPSMVRPGGDTHDV